MVDFKSIKPPTISRFLCFNLITGNLIIAWLHFVACILVFASLIVYLVFKSTQTIEMEGVELQIKEEDPDEFSDTFHIVVKLVVLVVVVFIASITYWFIHGINTADPNKMKPYLVLSFIYVVLAMISTIASLNFFVLVHTAIEIYFFVAAYSLFYFFSNETASQGLQQVIYANPSAHGYSRAIESEFDDGGNYQQQDYGNYEMQHGQSGYEEDQQQQQQGIYYQSQQ